jgi:plastocyanin
MCRLTCAAAVAMITLLLPACDDAGDSTAPQLESKVSGGQQRLVQMMDACDAETFNAALGPGTCTRLGGLNFTKFISLLGQHHSVGAWHFSPPKLNARVGQELLAVNQGGEEHTFTEVEEFGGGIIPALNSLSGNPVPAPECLALAPEDFVPPGGTYTDEVEEEGAERYQCCIHPWMRTIVNAKE